MTVKQEKPVISTLEPIITPEAPPVCQVTVPVYELPPEHTPARVARYVDIDMTPEDWKELEAVIFLEAGNQSAEGQQAVAEVVFNRVLHPGFPDTVHEVLHQGQGTDVPQFSVIDNLHLAEPNEEQYDAIFEALYGDSILPTDVVFFSRGGENDRVWGKIGDHVFCREYIWE